MKKFLTLIAPFWAALIATSANAQVTQMSDYVIFSGNGGAGTTTPVSPGNGVQIGVSSTSIGGSIGSLKLVKTTGTGTVGITGNIYSGGTVVLSNGNTVSGRITAANSFTASGTILSIGTAANLGGNIDVNGNVVVGSGTVSGRVTHPSGTTYSGPSPAGGNVTGAPALPTLPALPAVTTFTPFPNIADINTTTTITPGLYDDLKLPGNKTLTFNGPGIYVFDYIKNTGSNTFVFNFQNTTSGTFKIYVHNNVDVAALNVSLINGGSANRIYLETHGNGSTSSNGTYAFTIANGPSGGAHTKWMGTVWAPYAAINIGSTTGNCDVTGALWSKTQVNIQNGEAIVYAPYQNCAMPVASSGSNSPICAGITLNLTSGGGTTYSWTGPNGFTSTSQNPTISNATSAATGSYTVTVANGACTATSSVNVIVNALPVVSAGTYAAVCVNGSSITLTGSPAGGTFTGSGVTGNTFNPATAGVGTKTITYSYTNANGCSSTATTTIVVNAQTTVSAGTYAAVCVNGSSVTLAGSPAGGTFSGSGVTGNTFNPATAGVGTKTITYSYTNANGCSSSATTSIVVNAQTTVSAGTYAAVCVNGSSVTLAGSPAGGTFSGSGVTGNTFNPATAGVGTKTITYSYTNANGCSSSAATSIVVNAQTTVSAGTYAAVCINGSSVALTGSPAGGTFSGSGVTGNTFNPATAGVGTKTITYSYSNANGCASSATTNIVVNALPVVSAGSYSAVCVDGAAVPLVGSPAGGAFNGAGVTGNSFSPVGAGTGSKLITYTYNNGNCSNIATANILVNALPNVDAGHADSLACFVFSVPLAGFSTTPNAQFSWVASGGGNITGAANNANPAVDAQGVFTLTVTDPATGCSAKDVDTVGFIDCIFSGINEDGKSDEIIGIDLTSLWAHYDYNTHANPNPDLFLINNDKVWVEIVYNDGFYNTLLPYLTAAPFNLVEALFVDNGPNNRIITTQVDIAQLWNLNNLNISTGINMINHVRPVYPAVPTAGPAYSYGDVAQKSDIARNGFGVNGQGIKIGVISDSYNTRPGDPANAFDVPTGELPGVSNPEGFTNPVQVIQEYPYGPRTDEGRAMLQIVHDVAPGANLAFATGFISQGNMAQQIRNMKTAGCNAVVDDITYPTSPFFKDGLISRAIREVTAQGMTYITSAGNFGLKSCEGTFNGTAVPPGNGLAGQAHDFGGGDIYQSISLDSGTYMAVLQWEDDFYSTDQVAAGALSDLDWYLTYNNGTTLFGMNRDNNGTVQNPVGGDPFEVISFYVNIPAGLHVNSNILIVRDTGNVYPSNTRFKYVFFKCPSAAPVINQFSIGNSTIVGHANCDSAITVGAVRYSNTPAFGVEPTVASFSSVGGTTNNGVPVQKPDLSAPNGVNTTVDFGSPNEDMPFFTPPASDIYPNFYGTSAAAPHVAGIAALMMQAKMKFYSQTISPYQMKRLLTSTALDMYPATMAGFDNLSGYGLADADSGLRTFAAPTPDLIELQDKPSGYQLGDVVPSFTLIAYADYITTQSQIVFRNDTLPTIWIDAHHLSAVIPSFFGNPGFHIWTPPITNNGDGGNSDTLYFFTNIKRNVVIQANDKTKKFGEVVPTFTSTVTVDGLSLQDAGLTLADLGLQNIQYSTLPANVNFLSITGNYVINPEPDGPFDVGLTELYNYKFNNSFQLPPANGTLVIQKMPLVIKPIDKTVLYGDKIDGTQIQFTYTYDETNIALGDRAAFLANLKAIYEPSLVKQVALVDDRDAYNNGTLTQSDINNLAFVSGSKGIANGSKGIANGSRGIANGTTPDTTYVIDLPYQTLVQYNSNGTSITLSDDILLLNGSRGIANGSRGIANSASVVNGSALVNGSHGIANGSRGIANGSHGIVNGEELDGVSNTNTAVIIHDSDLDTQENPDSSFQMISINAITGLTAGSHWIIPGGFMSADFSVSYNPGHLFINPYEIKVDANDAGTVYGTAPAYSSVITGYQYNDVDADIFVGGISYSPASGSQINVGSHTIVPSATLKQPSNYYLTPVNGNIVVTPATLTITANNQNPACSSLPVFTSAITGYKFNDNAGNVIATMPSYTVLNNQQQPVVGVPPVGTYQIVPGGASLITPSNYVIQYVNGTLVEPAVLTATATATQPQCSNQLGSVSITPNGGTAPYTISGSALTNLGTGTYNYTITDANGCTTTASASIVVPSAITTTTSSTSSGCSSPTGSVSVSASGGTPPYSYLWSPGGQTTSSVSNRAIGSYTVVVTDSRGCTKSATVSVAANQSVPATPVWYNSGSDDNWSVGVCGGTTHDYEISAVSGITSRTWTAPAGANICDGQGHNGNPLTVVGINPNGEYEVFITFPSGFVSGNVTVYATNACGNSPVATKSVQSKPNTPGAISGQTTGLCNTSGKVYSIAAVPGATSYTWTKPSGTTISGSSNGTSINVTFGSSFTGTGTFTVKANNSCGSSATSSLTVDAKPAQPGTITGSTSVCKTNASVAYSIPAVTGASNYTWTISGGATFVGTPTGTTATVKYTTATSTSATLSVKANNTCGSSAVKTLAITVNLSCREAGDYQAAAAGTEFNVFPNPTSEKATVAFEAVEGSRATLDVYDLNGSLVSRILDGAMNQSGIQSVEVDCANLVKGIYFLRLTIGEETSVAKLVVIK